MRGNFNIEDPQTGSLLQNFGPWKGCQVVPGNDRIGLFEIHLIWKAKRVSLEHVAGLLYPFVAWKVSVMSLYVGCFCLWG